MGNILVADDAAMLRRLACRSLEGHRTVEAQDGEEALALVELKQTALAQARLQYLVEHFPQSEEAPLAKERLASLKE